MPTRLFSHEKRENGNGAVCKGYKGCKGCKGYKG
jgi:hypothetical protein